MHLSNVLTRSSKRFLQRCISSGCQYNTKHKINPPQFLNMVKATAHDSQEVGFPKLRKHISLLFGGVCGSQPVPGDPNSCFVSFKDSVHRYHAVNARVVNYTFEPIIPYSSTYDHRLFPYIAVVSVASQFDYKSVVRFVEEKAGQPDSFDHSSLPSNIRGKKFLRNIFFSFWDYEIYRRVVPDDSVHTIPGDIVLPRKRSNPTEPVKDASLYSYLPLYLDEDLSTMINSIVIEWESFKKVDCSIIFKIFETIGTVKGFESAGKNKVRVHFAKIRQSQLFSAFHQQSLLGRGLMIVSLKDKGWRDVGVNVYIPHTEDNPIFEKKLLPFIKRNSICLHNIDPDTDYGRCKVHRDNVHFVGSIFDFMGCNPSFISATYFPEEKQMHVLFEHAAYVDMVVDVVNKSNVFSLKNKIRAEPLSDLSNKCEGLKSTI